MEEIKYSEEIEKVINEKRTACRLYATEECELLNMDSCGECPVGEMKPEKQEKAKAALRRLMEAAPPEDVEELYNTKKCMLCREHPAQDAECFAMTDLKKEDPEGDWTIALGRKKLSVKGADMILPLQIACCKKCRAKYRLFEYLPTVAALLIAAAALTLLSGGPIYKALFELKSWLPITVMAAAAVLACAVYFMLKLALSSMLGKHMHADVSELPAVGKLMKEKGFTEVNEKRYGVSQFVFANERRTTGVYSRVTAPAADDGEEPAVCGEPSIEDIREPEPPLTDEGEKPRVCGVWPMEIPPETDGEAERDDGKDE